MVPLLGFVRPRSDVLQPSANAAGTLLDATIHAKPARGQAHAWGVLGLCSVSCRLARLQRRSTCTCVAAHSDPGLRSYPRVAATSETSSSERNKRGAEQC